MGTESTFSLIDPLSYHVNNIEDLDREVVKAFKIKDNDKIAEMTKNCETDFDVFICVNKGWHAFILCVPIPHTANDPMGVLSDNPTDDPFVVPGHVLCWVFELCFENQQLKLYKIKKEFNVMRDIKPRINKVFHIGKYKDVGPNAMQFAVLRAAPHRYNVLLNDCVEFAKEFCLCLLSYCSNYRKLESQVHDNIKKATASGFSVEMLSRRVQSSALIGNTFLGGLDASSFFSGRNGSAALILFILVYPLVMSCLISTIIIYFFK